MVGHFRKDALPRLFGSTLEREAWTVPPKDVGRKFFRGATEKRPKISKNYRKIALFSHFQGGQRKKAEK